MYRVLLVEDEDIIRKGLAFMMNWSKVNCVVVGEAQDGIEGLQKILELKPDIVITDIRMPRMSGLEMLQKALEDYTFYAILLSGYDDFEYARQGIRLGVEEYLLKPIDFDELGTCLMRIGDELKSARQYMDDNTSKLINEDILNQMPKSRRVEALLNEVKQNYADKLSLLDLGEKYEMTPSYLNSKFKKEIGYTFNDFLNRFRIMKANEILQTQEQLKVYEVAEMVGFSDYKYFIKVFKKYVGYPPLQMQQHFKG